MPSIIQAIRPQGSENPSKHGRFGQSPEAG